MEEKPIAASTEAVVPAASEQVPAAASELCQGLRQQLCHVDSCGAVLQSRSQQRAHLRQVGRFMICVTVRLAEPVR